MRLPLVPTAIVAAAIAAMVALGIWQLQRREWKAELIARYEAAAGQPPVAWPTIPPADDSLLFRRASGFCTEVVGWTAVGGRSAKGDSGWSHIAACRTGGLEGPGMYVDMGWSQDSDAPDGWRGGPVKGVIAPDKAHRIRLVADVPAPGLAASAPPSLESIPNNHLFYAIQWFFFATAAGVIYILALKRRQRAAPRP